MGDLTKSNENNIINIIHKPGGIEELGKAFSQKIYLLDIHIAGTAYVEKIKEREPEITVGKKLNFYREAKNEVDKFAIMVKDDQGRKLGYIPRGHNEVLARLMDAGKLLYGVVEGKEFIRDWLKITLKIYLDD